MDENREGEGGGLLDKVKDMLGGGEHPGEQTGETGGVQDLRPDTAVGPGTDVYEERADGLGTREPGDAAYQERTDDQSYGGMPANDTSRTGLAGTGMGNERGATSERDTVNEGGYSEYGESRDRSLDEGNTRDIGGY